MATESRRRISGGSERKQSHVKRGLAGGRTREIKQTTHVSQSIISKSRLSTSVEEYTREESFDRLPKTDYTYAKSGSYSPRNLFKLYVNPNMSRPRLRGAVTPPVSLLVDSDSDLEIDEATYSSHENQVHEISQINSASITHFSQSSRSRQQQHSTIGLIERDELDFALDSSRLKTKTLQDQHNRSIQTSGYRNYSDGMTLRSGSHLKGLKGVIETHDVNRQKVNSSFQITTDKELYISNRGHSRLSDSNMYDIKNQNDTVDNVSVFSTSLGKEEEVNINNSAITRSNRRSGSAGSPSWTPVTKSTVQMSQDDSEGKNIKTTIPWSLDHSEEYSDSDSYTSDGAYQEGYSNSSMDFSSNALTRSRRPARSSHSSESSDKEIVHYALWQNLFEPLYDFSKYYIRWGMRVVSTWATTYFLPLDTWFLSGRRRSGCCLCLVPLVLLIIPMMLFGSHLASTIYEAGSKMMPKNFFATDFNYFHRGTTITNLNEEIRRILMENEEKSWMTKAEVETLIQNMLNPDIESLRITLLNIAKESSSERDTLKIDQNDLKVRLATLEEQVAATGAKAKNMERELSDAKISFQKQTGSKDDRTRLDIAALRDLVHHLQTDLDKLQALYGEFTGRSLKCCMNDTTLLASIESNVKHLVDQIFTSDHASVEGFGGWLHRNYVDRKEFDRQLGLLTADITQRISASMEAQRSAHSSFVLPSAGNAFNENAVRLIVEDALMKYSADRTGMPDYALESAGGSVISTRCSETYYKQTALVSLFGIPLWYTSNSPRTVIQPEVNPGQCWAFKGQTGYIIIQLAVPIRPTGFSLEHIPKSLSMTGSIDSAPKDFTVFGLRKETETDGVNLGNFTYQTLEKPIQFFKVQISNPGVFPFVELRVLSNHGNPDYTCLYRFRAHGTPQKF